MCKNKDMLHNLKLKCVMLYGDKQKLSPVRGKASKSYTVFKTEISLIVKRVRELLSNHLAKLCMVIFAPE